MKNKKIKKNNPLLVLSSKKKSHFKISSKKKKRPFILFLYFSKHQYIFSYIKIFFIPFLILLLFTYNSQGILAELSLQFSSTFWNFNNADFKNYDPNTYKKNQAIQNKNTDDEIRIAYGLLRLLFETEFKNTRFFIDLSRSAYWGADNWQGNDKGQNPLNINQLYFIYYPQKDDTASMFKFGRFRYQIGNSLSDYFFYDIIDGFQYNLQAHPNVNIEFEGDIVSNSVKTDYAGVYGVIRKDEEAIDDFRGDTISSRIGFNFNFSFLEPEYVKKENTIFQAAGMRLFGYYLRYGANTKGTTDIAENGNNSYNKVDNDFLGMGGMRIYTEEYSKKLKFDFTLVHSQGQNHEYENKKTYKGQAFALNLNYHTFENTWSNILGISLGYFGDNFSSMRGRSMGGVLLWGYKNYFPAPYTNFYHFSDGNKFKDAPTNTDATNPKTFLRWKEMYKNGTYQILISNLFLWETKSKKYMGTELELEFRKNNDAITFGCILAAYFPSRYYIEQESRNDFVPQGQSTFYGISLYVDYLLDLDASFSKDKNYDTQKSLERLRSLDKDIYGL